MLFAKLALGLCGTVAVAGVYVFHEGVMRVDQDDSNGHHVHVWFPAAVVPAALYVVPSHYFQHAAEHARPWLPTLEAVTQELRKYPEAEFVDVENGHDHVRIRTHQGKLLIDVTEPDETVHIACPLVMMDDVAHELESKLPGA